MGLIIENFKMALSSVKANKMRSFLTMLGIIIGIASVITITSVGESTKAAVNDAFSSFGKNRVIIYMNFRSNETPDENRFISFEDIDKLAEKFPKEIIYISPWIRTSDTVKKARNEHKIELEYVNYNYIKELTTFKIMHGRDFQETDIKSRKNFAIVDEEFAKKLFGKENVVGEQFDANVNEEKRTLTIIGVYKKEKTIFDSLSGSDASEVLVPYTLGRDSYISIMDMKIDLSANPTREAEKIKKFITKYKRVKDDMYQINSLEDQIEQLNAVLMTLSLGLGAIAAISLIVGGIGIMNIMLVSVTERTKEIGIRKSLGARKKDILTQFLIESIMLSGVGGAIGTTIGIGISAIVAKIMNPEALTAMTDLVSVSSIIIAVGFSVIVGIFFGIFPAYKAASLDPIDALRYE